MKHLIVAISLLFSFCAAGQQEWVYNLSSLNFYEGISAAAGMYGRPTAALRHRQQWLGIEGAPQTQLLSFHMPLKNTLSFGTRIKHDRAGAFTQTSALAHLVYTLALSKSKLSFALGGGVSYDQLNVDNLNPLDADDPALLGGNTNQMRPLLTASLMYRSQKWFVGVEAQRLLAQKSNWNGLQTAGEVPEALVLGGVDVKMSEKWALRPMAAARISASNQLSPEAQLGAWYNKTFWFGAGYRWQSAAYAFVEYRFLNKYRVAYSFGVPVQAWQPAQSGSHEIMLSMSWGGSSSTRTQSLRYFQ